MGTGVCYNAFVDRSGARYGRFATALTFFWLVVSPVCIIVRSDILPLAPNAVSLFQRCGSVVLVVGVLALPLFYYYGRGRHAVVPSPVPPTTWHWVLHSGGVLYWAAHIAFCVSSPTIASSSVVNPSSAGDAVAHVRHAVVLALPRLLPASSSVASESAASSLQWAASQGIEHGRGAIAAAASSTDIGLFPDPCGEVVTASCRELAWGRDFPLLMLTLLLATFRPQPTNGHRLGSLTGALQLAACWGLLASNLSIFLNPFDFADTVATVPGDFQRILLYPLLLACSNVVFFHVAAHLLSHYLPHNYLQHAGGATGHTGHTCATGSGGHAGGARVADAGMARLEVPSEGRGVLARPKSEVGPAPPLAPDGPHELPSAWSRAPQDGAAVPPMLIEGAPPAVSLSTAVPLPTAGDGRVAGVVAEFGVRGPRGMAQETTSKAAAPGVPSSEENSGLGSAGSADGSSGGPSEGTGTRTIPALVRDPAPPAAGAGAGVTTTPVVCLQSGLSSSISLVPDVDGGRAGKDAGSSLHIVRLDGSGDGPVTDVHGRADASAPAPMPAAVRMTTIPAETSGLWSSPEVAHPPEMESVAPVSKGVPAHPAAHPPHHLRALEGNGWNKRRLGAATGDAPVALRAQRNLEIAGEASVAAAETLLRPFAGSGHGISGAIDVLMDTAAPIARGFTELLALLGFAVAVAINLLPETGTMCVARPAVVVVVALMGLLTVFLQAGVPPVPLTPKTMATANGFGTLFVASSCAVLLTTAALAFSSTTPLCRAANVAKGVADVVLLYILFCVRLFAEARGQMLSRRVVFVACASVVAAVFIFLEEFLHIEHMLHVVQHLSDDANVDHHTTTPVAAATGTPGHALSIPTLSPTPDTCPPPQQRTIALADALSFASSTFYFLPFEFVTGFLLEFVPALAAAHQFLPPAGSLELQLGYVRYEVALHHLSHHIVEPPRSLLNLGAAADAGHRRAAFLENGFTNARTNSSITAPANRA
eukprot:TRINITY_DN6650_c0_g1_i1.p1 TRINITY_DN6650_c0_g1~~TRINITY_DN6650_c0_g1_i1.p1  ORF type:complete len:992 (-),score=186.79 TRINITY_DN6650_c0_g1_i1:3-2978(-)